MLKQHLIIGAIGEPGVGRKTFLAFLSEIMAEEGYDNFCVLEGDLVDEVGYLRNSRVEVQSTEIYKVGTLLSTHVAKPKIVLVPNMKNINEANLIKHMGGILVRVRRNYYKNNGNGEVITNTSLPSEWQWLNDMPTDFHITNHETFRRFHYLVKDLFNDLIKHPKWKNCLK